MNTFTMKFNKVNSIYIITRDVYVVICKWEGRNFSNENLTLIFIVLI